jgi:farnesyl diphosphate synthase
MAAMQARVEAALERCLPSRDQPPQRLHEAMRYAVLGGGKRVRPLLAFAAGEAVGASAERVEAVACAVELIHAYSLVHDDLPCMDDDVLRRGRPTVHVEFDESTALLVGDALQAAAFELVSDVPAGSDHGGQLELVRLLARAAGSRGMAGGQAIDLESVGKSLTLPELEFMHILKTGALIRASVTLGARCGSPSPAALDRLDHYAKVIGLAFQVVDDTLDAAASTATLGKTAGKDAEQGKPTYVSLLGLARSRELAEELRGEAHNALAEFDARADMLRELADFVVLRRF